MYLYSNQSSLKDSKSSDVTVTIVVTQAVLQSLCVKSTRYKVMLKFIKPELLAQ